MMGFIIFYWVFSSLVTFAIMRNDDCSWLISIFGGMVIGAVAFPIILGISIGKILNLINKLENKL